MESDFAKNLAQEEAQEADAESEYQKVTQENKITKANKDGAAVPPTSTASLPLLPLATSVATRADTSDLRRGSGK